MKKYCFPSHASRIQGRFSKLTHARAALILAIVAGLSCLPFYVLAQDDVAATKSKTRAKYTALADRPAFIIYQGADGKAVCRRATAEEARALQSAPDN